MKNKSVLVIFGKEFPRKKKSWYRQFDEVIGPKEIESFIDPSSIREASRLVDNLSRLTLVDGSRLSKLINYRGYELWWMHYDSLYSKFCLPYTQYRRLLEHLKSFDKIYLHRAVHPGSFQYFLKAHGRQCIVLSGSGLRKFSPVPFGVLIQVFLSSLFLIWLKITKPKLMVWTSDQFDPAHPPHDFDFRMKYIYEELRKKEVPFVEFIRSQENLPTVLRHIWMRKRPVIYSSAIISFMYFLSKWLGKKKEFEKFPPLSETNAQDRFWASVAVCYLRDFAGTIWSIRAVEFILRWIGVRSAIILPGSSRTFHEILACKLNGIKTIGIQHGLAPRYLNVYEFMPSFDGEFTITTDIYGLCSNWWREYFILYSRAFRPEQLYISGHMRPFGVTLPKDSRHHVPSERKSLKVLFISEELAAPSEVMPYLLILLGAEDLTISLKFRSYRDVFEEWLKENNPAILEKANILKSGIHEAIAQSDIAVGSYSTGVLEALLQLKPIIFFRTRKWGDCFEMKSFGSGYFFAETPKELLERIRKNQEIPKNDLLELRERFFGNPYQNGSKWVVDQALKFL